MINLLDNKVLGPMILQAEESGRIKGIEQGMNTLLHELLSEMFGPLPEWAHQRLHAASAADLHAWSNRILHEPSLESILR